MTNDYDYDDELTPEERFYEFLEEAWEKGQTVFRHEWCGFYADTAEVCAARVLPHVEVPA